MSKPIITIIGLGTTGTSLGLGLQRTPGNFDIVGHDKNPEVNQQARQAGAVQRAEWNLHRACEGSELIVLATPLDQVPDLLGHIAEDLKPTTLLLAISPLLQPLLNAIKTTLPNHTYAVVGRPVVAALGPLPSPRADLFDGSTFALATTDNTDPAALELASNFVGRVGATALFVDALEHDGMMAGVEQLPQLFSAILMNTNSRSPSWREAQRLAGRAFAQTTDVSLNPAGLAESLRTNRASLLQRIDQLQRDLARWRELLATDPPSDGKDALLEELLAASQTRITWEGAVTLKHWDVEPPSPGATEARQGMLRQMLLGGLGGRRGESKNRK
ncbi:MAG: prephenate dehydrogenase/arogenate dehydrogenase family protein [Caldilineaceae bacterium]